MPFSLEADSENLLAGFLGLYVVHNELLNSAT